MNEPKRCSRCILPETFPGIAFDDQGVCNFCSSQRATSVLGEANLRELLHAERGETYDCVVPISGGKDSTYVMYYAVKRLDLRVIAVNYDSGFQSDLARENVIHICNKLNVPLVVARADYGTHLRMLEDMLRVSEIAGTFFHICMNCEVNIRTSAINTAREHHVPFILFGSSEFESIGSHAFLGRKALFKQIPRTRMPKLAFHLARYSLHSIRQRAQMKVPIRWRFRPMSGVVFPEQKPRIIYFFDYVEWDSMDKVGFLREELGWRSPGDRDDRFDCSLHCFGNHHWLQACGVSVDGFTYSNMIRGNRMQREDGIMKERTVAERIEEDCLKTLERLGLQGNRVPRV
jgi:glucosamine--fructose-6-phosphate aminotransferase (isomerizing)